MKNGKLHSILPVCSLHSPHIGYATLSHNALGFHADTVSNGFLSEVFGYSVTTATKSSSMK